MWAIWACVNTDTYDVRLFEALPLQVQTSVIERHVVVMCNDLPSFFEYFYHYRRQWEDLTTRLTAA